MIKILQNGIKHDNGYTPCFYSMGNNIKHSDKCITIYARDYEDLPAELGDIQNDSDGQSDYFENDRCVLEPGDKFYNEELAAATGFPKDYIFTGTKVDVVKQIGNAVPPNFARALFGQILREMTL